MFSVCGFGTCRWDLFGANGNYLLGMYVLFFWSIIGIDGYCCLAFVGLSEHCILCYKFLIQLFYNM